MKLKSNTPSCTFYNNRLTLFGYYYKTPKLAFTYFANLRKVP